MTDAPRLLVVDDDPAVSGMLDRSLSRHGFACDAVNTPQEALDRAAQGTYVAAFVDLVMPGRNGAELARLLREQAPGLPVGVLTGYANSPLIAEARRAGARVFAKPVSIEDLVAFLDEELPAHVEE